MSQLNLLSLFSIRLLVYHAEHEITPHSQSGLTQVIKGSRHLPYLEKKLTPWVLQVKIMVTDSSRNIAILHRPSVTFRAS